MIQIFWINIKSLYAAGGAVRSGSICFEIYDLGSKVYLQTREQTAIIVSAAKTFQWYSIMGPNTGVWCYFSSVLSPDRLYLSIYLPVHLNLRGGRKTRIVRPKKRTIIMSSSCESEVKLFTRLSVNFIAIKAQSDNVLSPFNSYHITFLEHYYLLNNSSLFHFLAFYHLAFTLHWPASDCANST